MIDGRCVSIGCLAMSDERAQEIWVATTTLRYAGGVLHVHIFPTKSMSGLLERPEGDAHRPFWENLRGVFDHFERTRRIPRIRIDPEGRYRVLG
jgi:murein L,D-transpeptidase YafK